MKAIDRRVRRLEESFTPQENEEVGRLVTLLRERRRRRLEASGEPFEEGHARLFAIKIGRYQLPTFCAGDVDALSRPPNSHQDSFREWLSLI